MEAIQIPQTSENPIKKSSGYWITRWSNSEYASREESKNSPASVKILNYVSELLTNIVNGLKKNFSKLYSKTEGLEAKIDDLGSKIQDAHSKISDNDEEHEKRQEELLSEIEDLHRKVDSLQATFNQFVGWIDYASNTEVKIKALPALDKRGQRRA
uniref:Uncharacterized protein n=1 Tax=Picea sitchensis TaxID=3332 RepID=A9NT03_PICSI|nr:unknown [Picea sitchensis]